MTETILLTGFGPFPGAPYNPTGPLVMALARRRHPAFANVRRVAHIFQVSYEAVDRELPALLQRERPAALIMFGLATRATQVRVEMRARNAITRMVPDVSGRIPLAAAIRPGAPPTVPLRTPAQRLLSAARATGVPVALSRDAGRYLCNYLCWRAIEITGQTGGPRLVVFVHVPQLRHGSRRRSNKRSWRMADLMRGGEAILLALIGATRQQRHMKER
jgi:pyroglutamyl-peptidase